MRKHCGVGVRQTLAASVPEALAGSGGIGYPMSRGCVGCTTVAWISTVRKRGPAWCLENMPVARPILLVQTYLGDSPKDCEAGEQRSQRWPLLVAWSMTVLAGLTSHGLGQR